MITCTRASSRPLRPWRWMAACAALLAGCERITERPETVDMGATLLGGRVRPDSVETTASGTFSGVLSSVPEFTYTISFAGLSSAPATAHLHGPADTNEVAPILVDFAAPPAGHAGTLTLDATSGTGSGTLDLTAPVSPQVSGDSLHALLRAGRVYVDVHSADHGAGELRGQLRRH